jgi:hypothetical protein
MPAQRLDGLFSTGPDDDKVRIGASQSASPATRDAFLSYSSRDKPVADAICAALERERVRCWIAPRDIVPGRNYGEAIIDGINACRLLVVVLSAASNRSPQVLREVERAVHRGLPVIPFRIEQVTPSKSMEYFLSAPHWLDALTPPVEAHISHLTAVVRAVLEPDHASSVGSAAPVAEHGGPNGAESLPRWRMRPAWWAALGMALVAAVITLIIAMAPSGGSSDLQAEYETYRSRVLSGRGSIAFLKESAPERYADWLRHAEAGDPIAQLFIGRCHQEGLVVGKDLPGALPWLEKSATSGNDFAMHTLGLAHEEGSGVPPDASKALSWYTKAAELGNPISMRAIGLLHSGSAIDRPNPERALTWYRKAADAGDPPSMRLIGNCYQSGSGVEKDEAESQAWYEKAVAAGDAYSIGRQLGNRLSEPFAAYLAEGSTPEAKSEALRAIEALRGEYDQLDLLPLEAIFERSDLRNAVLPLFDLPADEPLRAAYDRLVGRYQTAYAAAARSERTLGIGSFSLAVDPLIRRQHEAQQYDAVAGFWTVSYADIPLSEVDAEQELSAFVRQLNWSATSLMRTGQRKEAESVINAALELCDRSLQERPWDWYTKDACAGLCFSAADAWIALGERAAAQPLLRRGWGIRLRQYGHEDILERVAELPQSGKVPAGATEEDRKVFAQFSPDQDKKESGIKRFTIPCDFAGRSFPFHVYVLTGKRGYAELQDQFRWLNHFRGGEVPPAVKQSFRDLNELAVKHNVDFMELCVFAFDEAAKKAK